MTETNNKPIETIRLSGGIRAKLWVNTSKDGKPYIAVDVARTYKHQDGFGDSSSFGLSDLLTLAKVADMAYERGVALQRELDSEQETEDA